MLARRRSFRVPVFNRGASLRIAALVQAPLGSKSLIQLACDHPGLRLLFQPPRHLFFGVDRSLAALVGLLAGLVFVAALVVVPLQPVAVAFLAFAAGSLTAAIGAGVVRGVRWILRLLG